MASTSEDTFGRRLNSGYELAGIIENMPDYTPANSNLSFENFTILLDDIRQHNLDTATRQAGLSTQRETRRNLYFAKPAGLVPRSSRIRDYISSLPGGKRSANFLNVQSEVQKMYNYQRRTGSNDTETGETESGQRRISQSERSFGSMLETGQRIAGVLTNMGTGYAPTIDDLKLANRLPLMEDIGQKNVDVASALAGVKVMIAVRKRLYTENNGLRERITQIKAYIRARFGRNSPEYISVKHIRY